MHYHISVVVVCCLLFTPCWSIACVSGVHEGVPLAHLLAFGFPHVGPVVLLLLAGAIEAQRYPAQTLAALHAAAATVNGHMQCHLRELEQGHLEDERLLVCGVGLAAANRRLALGHLLALGVQHDQLYVGVCKAKVWGGRNSWDF